MGRFGGRAGTRVAFGDLDAGRLRGALQGCPRQDLAEHFLAYAGLSDEFIQQMLELFVVHRRPLLSPGGSSYMLGPHDLLLTPDVQEIY